MHYNENPHSTYTAIPLNEFVLKEFPFIEKGVPRPLEASSMVTGRPSSITTAVPPCKSTVSNSLPPKETSCENTEVSSESPFSRLRLCSTKKNPPIPMVRKTNDTMMPATAPLLSPPLETIPLSSGGVGRPTPSPGTPT
mmetsp:Transcript_19455/g.33283  ORF Transcript_19455/g.33283 Transcript_19455/m.33283 type:complete len:139 (+) Transcript_19455:56-472(+)